MERSSESRSPDRAKGAESGLSKASKRGGKERETSKTKQKPNPKEERKERGKGKPRRPGNKQSEFEEDQ